MCWSLRDLIWQKLHHYIATSEGQSKPPLGSKKGSHFFSFPGSCPFSSAAGTN